MNRNPLDRLNNNNLYFRHDYTACVKGNGALANSKRLVDCLFELNPHMQAPVMKMDEPGQPDTISLTWEFLSIRVSDLSYVTEGLSFPLWKPNEYPNLARAIFNHQTKTQRCTPFTLGLDFHH